MTLRLRDVRFTYSGWPPTLSGVDLEVPAGASIFLLGPSGSGKSTLLRCIAGLERAEGAIAWDGEDLASLPTHRRGVGLVFQDGALFPHLNAWRNVAFGLRYCGVARRGERAEAMRWLAKVNLEHKADAPVQELSGGERGRVALARTLAAQPRVVLLDEPFANLDRALRDELGARVKAILAEQRVAALWVTHDRDEAFRLGDAVWELKDGRLVPAAA